MFAVAATAGWWCGDGVNCVRPRWSGGAATVFTVAATTAGGRGDGLERAVAWWWP